MNQLAKKTDEPRQEVITQADSPDSALAIVGRMVASGAQKETIDQMVALIEWDDARKARMAFNSAFAMAKGKFKQAKKSGKNKHLNSTYSLLEDYDDATRDALSGHGLSWRHVPRMDGDTLYVRCILAHQAGHTEEAELHANAFAMKNNAVNALQSEGIVLMYLKRMTLSSVLGIVSDSEFDNDGNGGAGVERITHEQVAFLTGRLDSLKADKAAFLKRFKIEKLEDLVAAAYKDAVRVIDQKEEHMKAQANAKTKA